MKNFRFAIYVSILCLALFGGFAGTAMADDVTVINASSAGWVQISTNTFGLPANLTEIGCGSENETSCEPAGVFKFNVSFASSGALNILDSAGEFPVVSDQIQFFNDSATGLGVVLFFSDPSLANISPGGTPLCTEAEGSGCVAPFTIMTTGGQAIVLTAASDAESVFDPFGLGADSSDELQVTSGAVIGTPEPGTLALMGFGILGLAALKFAKR